MSEPYLGEIKIVPYNFTPKDWAFCAGQIAAISENQALFALLGTTYGGDGRTSYGLPDLRGRVPVGSSIMGTGPGLNPIPLGQKGGTPVIDYTPSCNYSFTLTEAQMPSHTHTATLRGESTAATAGNPKNKMLATAASNVYASPIAADDKDLASESITVSDTGGGQPVTGAATGQRLYMDNRGPYLGLNYVIAMQGIFPSRN